MPRIFLLNFLSIAGVLSGLFGELIGARHSVF